MTAPTHSGATRAVVFTVGQVEFAVTGRVLRSLPATSPMPRAIDLLGEAVPVLELPKLFGATSPEGEEGLLLLVDQAGKRRAVVIQELVGFEEVDLDALQPIPSLYPPKERRRWAGALPREDGSLLVVLHLDGMLENGREECA